MVQEVAGSNPVFHPKVSPRYFGGFFVVLTEFAQKNGIQGRVFVQFFIEKDGNISGIRSRGPHGILERAAERIIEKLPKMTPSYQRGLPVKVFFSIPITFKLQ